MLFFLCENLCEQDALKQETYWIKRIGRNDLNNGTLINFTNGGEGTTGHRHTEESKAKISKANIGKLNSNYNGATITDEWRKNQSISQSKVLIYVYDTFTNLEYSFINSKLAGEFCKCNPTSIRNYKNKKYRIKRRYLISSKTKTAS